VILSAVFITTLDAFVVNVAIPSIQSGLPATPAQIQWVLVGFVLAIGAGVITGGRLGDVFGRRRMFWVGLALFVAASAACGLAPDANILIGARVVQGLAAALVNPQVLALITTLFSGKGLTRAVTLYGLTMGVAAVFGQLIGGALIQADAFGLGWRSCFLINVPIGAVALAMTRRAIPAENTTARVKLDLVGTALVSAALVALVLPLIQGQAQGWPLWTWASMALAVCLFVVFTVHQSALGRRGGAPLVDLGIFRDRAFTAGTVVQLVAWMGIGSFFLILAVYLQQGLRLTALQSGVLFMSIGVPYVAASLASGSLAARFGKQTISLGAAGMAAGLFAMIGGVALSPAAESAIWLIPGLILEGAGMGLVIAPITGVVLARVAPERAGGASGVLSAVMQVGGAVGIAIVGGVFYGTTGHVGTSTNPLASPFIDSLVLLIGLSLAVIIGVQCIANNRNKDLS
jgi:EmrB/QacA subfamily drug resistance transporter